MENSKHAPSQYSKCDHRGTSGTESTFYKYSLIPIGNENKEPNYKENII